ncbi:hypothetical protein PRK78_002505 [Emydomyces testavorans]|uniref:NADP-dependent oxidoreductase domain-containing protein n=1 Tax=Emydomyces testavorans TaxID=2070801 RepID=A0AAF0DEC4_9EURO|nr:hypothetical protein PRK78_002505 [Emydomyces testavorans]
MPAFDCGEQEASRATQRETFKIGHYSVPRLFVGLWQLSSPAWGSAPRSRIMAEFQKYVDAGFTAFDMADHYGDAELLFGRFRSSYPGPKSIFCATKYCVFAPIPQTEEVVHEAVSQRLRNIKSETVDLLQYHWQHIMQADPRVTNLGLCNFDTKRMKEVLEAGINIVTNQVQCGGFLAEKWLGKPAPEAFSEAMTPSLRKVTSLPPSLPPYLPSLPSRPPTKTPIIQYLEMITIWGGWPLFQTLLSTLSTIAAKHSASISTVAVRWVLDFPYVGAVLVGARMGVSQHMEENLAVYGWSLDEEDREKIEDVLAMSRRDDVFADMGDCGSEYRVGK